MFQAESSPSFPLSLNLIFNSCRTEYMYKSFSSMQYSGKKNFINILFKSMPLLSMSARLMITSLVGVSCTTSTTRFITLCLFVSTPSMLHSAIDRSCTELKCLQQLTPFFSFFVVYHISNLSRSQSKSQHSHQKMPSHLCQDRLDQLPSP